MPTPADQSVLKTAPVRAAGGSASLQRVVVVDKPRFSSLIRKMLANRFDVVCADSAPEAIATIRLRRPDVIVADVGLQGEGLQLAELLDMNAGIPHTPFILTCIKTPANMVEQARAVGVDTLLVKPFPPSGLIERIGTVLDASPPPRADGEAEEVVVTDAIRARRRPIFGLPPFPDAPLEILREADGEMIEAEEIAEKIQTIPDTTAALVELAGPLLGKALLGAHPLKQAVASLGPREVANLTVCLQAFKSLSGYESRSNFDPMAFWKHAVGTGFIARAIAQHQQTDAAPCFTAGFLHDVGKVVLDRFFPIFFSRSLEVIQRQKLPSIHAELETLGTTHAHIGGFLAASWKFDDDLMEAIVCHHDPSAARYNLKLTSIVHVASAICNHFSYGASEEAADQILDDPAFNRSLLKLGIGLRAFQSLTTLGRAQLESADAFFSTLTGIKTTQ